MKNDQGKDLVGLLAVLQTGSIHFFKLVKGELLCL